MSDIIESRNMHREEYPQLMEAEAVWGTANDRFDYKVRPLRAKTAEAWKKGKRKSADLWSKAREDEPTVADKAKRADLTEGAKALWIRLKNKLEGTDDTPLQFPPITE
jgi:hypothetical protein